jgi:hypothetical protein
VVTHLLLLLLLLLLVLPSRLQLRSLRLNLRRTPVLLAPSALHPLALLTQL